MKRQALPTEPGPVLVRELELTEPVPGLERPARHGQPYVSVRYLVRVGRRPVGYATMALTRQPASPQQVAVVVWQQLANEIKAEVAQRGGSVPTELPLEGLERLSLPSIGDAPLVSVVMCTRNRPEGAVKTLKDLCALTYPNFEIIVVDNASSDDATKARIESEFGHDHRVRYVRENKPGLSFARNRGIAEAKGKYLAYTDDDVRVDRYWLDALVSGFLQSDNVGCVTGLVPSAELESPIEQYFDARYTWGTRFSPVVYDYNNKTDGTAVYPYSPGIFGTGANFAFELSTIKEVGGFDESLGAGTPSGGGEDLDAFIKVLRDGKEIVQEPAAIIWHVHRSDPDELRKQLFNYGSGLTAFLTKHLLDPATSLSLLKRLVPGALKLHKVLNSGKSGVASPSSLPASVLAAERRGMMHGPRTYFMGQRNRRRIKSGNYG